MLSPVMNDIDLVAQCPSAIQEVNISGTPRNIDGATVSSVEISCSITGRNRKRRKMNSWFWNHLSFENESIVCRECVSKNERKMPTFATTTATGTLARHLETKLNIQCQEACLDFTQSNFSNQSVLQRHNVMNPEAAQRVTVALAHFLVDVKVSFRTVENKAFQKYARCLNRNAPIVSRRTLVRTIEEDFDRTRPIIIQALQKLGSRFALTRDGWSPRVMRGYFVITVHWISEAFLLKSVVLEFLYFPPPHNQFTTRDLLKKRISEWKLESRIRYVTTDSGSETEPAMEHVRTILNRFENTCIPSDWHLRCAFHIVHNAVKSALHPLR